MTRASSSAFRGPRARPMHMLATRRGLLALGVVARLGARTASTRVADDSEVVLRPGRAVSGAEQTIYLVRHAEGWHNKDARDHVYTLEQARRAS